MTSRRAAAAAALTLSAALALTACGSSSASSSPSGESSASASGSTASSYVTGTAGVTVSGAAGSKPTVKLGDATKDTDKLTVSDITVGTGEEVKPGDSVTAQYVGIGASSGKQFDSAWDRGSAAQFSLDSVIQGWQQGIPGMKVGGRRLLVIPGALAYGDNPPSGSGIEKNETLVFVVDLVPTPKATAGPHVEGTAGVTVTGDAGQAPTIAVTPETAKTGELTIHDVTEGTGPEAKPDSTVTIQYVGVGAESGKKFDSSWDRGQPATFALNQVIEGFKDGVSGMKVGGRRVIVIPGAQGYGANPPAGSGIGKNENLVFVVDLVSVK